MTYFADLTPCRYFRGNSALMVAGRWAESSVFEGRLLLAVGWLELYEEFTQGPVDPGVRHALGEMVAYPRHRSPYLGFHHCSFCRYAPRSEPMTSEDWARIPHSAINLFVPGKRRKVVYVAPALIVHYIDAHGYRPPDAFCDAVKVCPPMGSPEYFARLDPRGIAAFEEMALPELPEIPEIELP